MGRQRKPRYIFSIHIGGLFAEPNRTETGSEVDPSRVKQNLAELLGSTKDKVEWVSKLDKDKLEDSSRSFGDSVLGRHVEHGFEAIAYWWSYPLIFKLKVDKETNFSDLDGSKSETISPIEAIIAYNGMWFTALADDSQFSSVEEYFFSGPRIRDVLVGILKNSKEFAPVVVPPCIIPRELRIEVYTKDDEEENQFQRKIKSIGTSSSEDSLEFTVKYRMQSASITDEDVIEIIQDIYFDLRSSLSSFYMLMEQSNRTQRERNDVSEMYDQACSDLQEYMKVPFWNILRKCQIAGALRKNVSNIQVQLARNRFSQVAILNKAEEINTLRDHKGIIENMRAYLRERIVKDFASGAVEYEGLTATLSHMERLASQHDTILLGVVAIVAGIIGVFIGAWIN